MPEQRREHSHHPSEHAKNEVREYKENVQIEHGPETETVEVPPTLWRNTGIPELYLLWRDRELPLGAFPGHMDSTIEPNSVGTFWFAKPVKIFLSRGVFLGIDTDKLDHEDNVTNGVMTFTVPPEHPTTLQADDAWLAGRPRPESIPGYTAKVNEFFVHERIPIEKLKIFLQDWLNPANSLLKSIEYLKKHHPGYVRWEETLKDTIMQIGYFEFGNDFATLTNKIQRISKQEKEKITRLDKEGWIILDEDDEKDDHVTFIREEYLNELLKSVEDFAKWLQTLSEADIGFSSGEREDGKKLEFVPIQRLPDEDILEKN